MKKSDYVMSPSELKALREERGSTEQILRAVESDGYGGSRSVDRERLRSDISRYDKLVKQHSPKPVRGVNKDKMVARARELTEQIKEGMPTRSEMNDMRRNPGAPYKNLAWEKRNAERIGEYKQIMRRLEPGDPSVSSIEGLRRNR